MTSIANPLCRVAVATLLLGFAAAAPAQVQRSGSAGPNAQAMQQLQQLAAERTRLQAENAKLKADLEKLRKEKDSAEKARDAADARARATQSSATRGSAEAERLQADLARERERQQELVARFRETANTLREVETDRNATKQSLAQRDIEIKACVDRNQQLLALNGEVLDAMENRGFWAAMTTAEPFTRIKRNQLENLVDGYRLKAEDQRVDQQGQGPASR